MTAGRPQQANPGALYAFAHQFYWELRTIAEGRKRQRLDRAEFEKLSREIDQIAIHITPEEKARFEAVAESEILAGRLNKADKNDWIRGREQSHVLVNREWLREQAAQRATKELRVPGEPDIITKLHAAKTIRQIRALCKDAFTHANREVAPGIFRDITIPNWPISVGSMLPSYLSQYASEIIAAKADPRFPKSAHRPTSRLKQLWFLSRALAGAVYGIKTRTAINLVGSVRPEESFKQSRAAKSARKRTKITNGRARKARAK